VCEQLAQSRYVERSGRDSNLRSLGCKSDALTTRLYAMHHVINRIIFTVFRKKTPTYVFDYNSGVSWSILILFVPLETGINTLQYTYLMP